MNKKLLFPLALVPLAATSLQSTEVRPDTACGQTPQHYPFHGRRHGMARHFTPLLDTKDRLQ